MRLNRVSAYAHLEADTRAAVEANLSLEIEFYHFARQRLARQVAQLNMERRND